MNFYSYTEWVDTGETKKQKFGINKKMIFSYVNDIVWGNKKHIEFMNTTV